MSSFYIAGKVNTGEDKVRQVANFLTSKGWTWSLDWTTLSDVVKPYLEHIEANATEAEKMVLGVKLCDLFIYMDDPSIFGGLIETGIAIGQGKPVILYGENIRQSIFWCLPNVYLAGNMDQLEEIVSNL